MKKCHQLTPAEMLDRKVFTAQRFPILFNLCGEEYAGTIRRKGDGAEAILDYLRSGGCIVMLTSQPLPFYYDGVEDSHRTRSLTPEMGMPIAIVFEKPPEGASLKIRLNPAQKLVTDMPAEIAYAPRDELRLRSISPETVSADADYTPIFTVTGADGKNYGDAAASARFTRGQFRGGRLVYVWSGLTGDRQLGPRIIEQLMDFVIAESRQ
jgi:hypothetical protein